MISKGKRRTRGRRRGLWDTDVDSKSSVYMMGVGDRCRSITENLPGKAWSRITSE